MEASSRVSCEKNMHDRLDCAIIRLGKCKASKLFELIESDPNCFLISGDTIMLEGMNSYEAATHCASLMAAQRLATGGRPAFVAAPTLPYPVPCNM